MALEEFFNRSNILDLSFFNFRNAISACYFADRDLRIQRTNDNFGKFVPRLGNIANAPFLGVLEQLGVEAEHIDSFTSQLEADGHVFIPKIPIRVDGVDKVFSLMSTYTKDPSFSYLNGVQGQFVDRTAEWDLRKEREKLLEEKLRDRELIEDKTRQLERLASRLAKYLSPQIYDSIFSGKSETRDPLARRNLTIFFSDIEGFTDISDSMEPERLSFFMDTYLSEMSNIALQYGGSSDPCGAREVPVQAQLLSKVFRSEETSRIESSEGDLPISNRRLPTWNARGSFSASTDTRFSPRKYQCEIAGPAMRSITRS